LQVVEAERWVELPENKSLQGDALEKALKAQTWDPSVKSLVPFPQVLAMMNAQLDWMQQLGYAVTSQQPAVMDSVQRLRRQAQAAGSLQTTKQQVVRTQAQTIIIEPAEPTVVYVPAYNPTVVYGVWPYPAYPPVYMAPPPGYVAGSALVAGLAFGTGVAIAANLWGWSSPNWNHGDINVNVNRYNTININRPPINNPNWHPGPGPRPPAPGPGPHPPAGPVGAPNRAAGLPANAIGRPSVSVPGSAVRPSQTAAGAAAAMPGRPTGGAGPQQAQSGQHAGAPGAFSGMNEGRGATEFANRGAQSRMTQMSAPPGGAGRSGGAGRGVHFGR
jgi:hypothetical protein